MAIDSTNPESGLIGKFRRAGHEIEVFNIKGRYTIFDDNRITQRDLSPNEFVRWACNGLEDGS